MDRLKSSFIGVITHELRSPFVAVDLSVQLLERYLERGMYDELQGQIQQLDRELIEGRRLIDSVISFASLVSKQGDLFLEETDIAALAREVTAPLDKMAAARNITLTFHFPANLPRIRSARFSAIVAPRWNAAVSIERVTARLPIKLPAIPLPFQGD